MSGTGAASSKTNAGLGVILRALGLGGGRRR